MKFTDKFIELPVKIFDQKEKELMGKAEYLDSYLKINPFEISNYKPVQDEDNDDVDCVAVHLKNGYNFYVYMTIEEFENILNGV